MILETPRLLLRDMTVEDAPNAYELNLDPEVVRFTGDLAFTNVEEARAFLENYIRVLVPGYGRQAVMLKGTGDFLGWCGLRYQPDLDAVDLGYRFHRRHWGLGYATEAGQASLRYGFETLGLDEIFGQTMDGNTASEKVLEKLGFQFEKGLDWGPELGKGKLFKLSRERYDRLGD